VSNALTATIDNNIERVFDFIVAEDVVTKYLKGDPALLSYDMEVGPWNHSGATRINTFADGSKLRETVIDMERPASFQYMQTEFHGGGFEGLVDLGLATFKLSPAGPRTDVNWTFDMRPASPDKLDDVRKFMIETWKPWMNSFFDALKKALNKDPWSA